jgi:CRP-like cAMP-binding protein
MKQTIKLASTGTPLKKRLMARKVSTMIENALYARGVIPTSCRFSDTEKQLLDDCFVKQPIMKNHVIISENVNDSIYFVEEGVLMHQFKRNDKHITFNFTLQGEFTCINRLSLSSVHTYYIQTLYDGVVWKVDINAFYAACLQSKLLTGALLSIISSEVSENIYHLLSVLELSPEERYLYLLQEQSKLMQEVPLKYLASYIGITPQSLSRMRRRIR